MSETLTETPRPALAVTREPFGRMPDGTPIWRYRLTNRCRMTVELVTYGARIHAIHVPDMHGNNEDITLGFDSLEGYLSENDAYFGATIGRYANRIGGARFDVNGTTHELSANEGANTLHGGHNGLDSCVWASESFDAGSAVGVEMTYFSPDGEMGFPGNLAVTVRYTLDDANRLRLHYSAVCDRATPVNLTNHVYFNLAGAGMPSVLEHVATLNASRFTPVNEAMIPTGALESVAYTPLDFMRPRRIGDAIDDDHEQLIRAGGYDHNWVLDTEGDIARLAARVIEPESGRGLEMFTTEPGVQFYTGNNLPGGFVAKNDKTYPPRSGFCLEAQRFPDAPNQAGFPDTILRPGAKYGQTTIYRFLPDRPPANTFFDDP